MTTQTRIYHSEVVGSLLRPPELVEARRALRAGELDPQDYRAVEDRAVDEALRLQEAIGLDVVTDGEMRRDIFFEFLIKGMSGLEMKPGYTVRFHSHEDPEAMVVQIPFTVTETIAVLPCPAVDEFGYARERTSKPLKVTLPSPVMMLGLWGDESKDAYPDPLELVADAGAAVKRWALELADAGCEYIQLDAPDLIDLYCDENVRAEYESRGIPAADLRELGTQLAVEIGELDLPGVTRGMHLCRGNGTQSWIAEGGYDDFAEHVFARATGYDVFHLEYDDERSGGFEPLAELPEDKVAALGLVSTKWQQLEDPDMLKARIRQAAKYHPLERLALAPQCGFASAAETADERKLTEQTQRDKLQLVVDVARDVWG
jgi:methionine synthase II (cobalamin-independent)